MRTYTISDALQSLVPDAKWEMMFGEFKHLKWLSPDIAIPSEDEVLAELARIQAIENSREYLYKRGVAYPSIPDQLDLIFHEGIDAWKAKIQEVKDRFPKS